MSVDTSASSELKQLQRRFGDALRVRDEHEYTISFRPTDPDVYVDFGTIHLSIALPNNYPQSPANIAIIKANAPDRIIKALNLIIENQCRSDAWVGSLHVKKCVQWLDNHFSAIVGEIVRIQSEVVSSSKAATTISHETSSDSETPATMPVAEVVTTQELNTENTVVDSTDGAAHHHSVGEEWTYEEQFRLERALREVFVDTCHDMACIDSWKAVASRVSYRKSPAACIARFLSLRRIAKHWLDAVSPAEPAAISMKRQHSYPDPHISTEVAHESAALNMLKPAGTSELAFSGHGDGDLPSDSASEDSWTSSSASDDEVPSGLSYDVHEAMEYGPADAEADAYAEGGLASGADPSKFAGLVLDPPHQGTKVFFVRPSIFGIGTLAANRLDVHAQCDRCATVFDASLGGVKLATDAKSEKDAPPASHKAWCPKCSLLHELDFRPMLVHDGNPSLGYVITSQCSISGLREVGLFASCLECGLAAEIPRFSPPMTWEVSCRSCYSRLRLDVKHWASEIATRENAVARAFDPREAAKARRFQAGRSLPDEGTCRHFRQSYRWLRFPCCGTAYPCPMCHDEGSDHPHAYATRMICGHCAREQPFRNEPCVSCGKGLTRNSGPTTRFWEGGSGQRNRHLLSRKDPRKFKDSKMKTHSKKSERVGAKSKKK